jgi:murein DD-endopeptidase MepM/ murein hydrolase activator NlpD
MIRNVFFHDIGGFALRTAGLTATGFALLLCAPLLDSSFEPPTNPTMQEPAQNVSDPAPEPEPRVDVKLKRGDTLLSLLNRYGVEAPSAHNLIAKMRPLLNLRKLRPGKNVQLVLHPEDQTVEAMEVVIDDKIVSAKATTEGWMVERREIPSVSEIRVIRGTIEDSLYVSGISAGLTPEHVMQLAGIFEYDIDFFSDFKPGDDFVVVLEETRYADGRQVPRRVLAADLQADGKTYSAFHFSSKAGNQSYYDSKGNELRSSFLRAPLSFTRISSRYSLARRHPISRTLRPHRAIDYAAPAGTPVIAIGKGRVTFSGWRGGYGKCVEVRHSGGYASRYGHFSRIAPGIRKGAEVDAGDVIGFVGQTGHATGPHLHFEFLQGDKKINFLTVKIPRSEHLTGAELQRFKRERDQHLAQLRQQRQVTSTAQAGL